MHNITYLSQHSDGNSWSYKPLSSLGITDCDGSRREASSNKFIFDLLYIPVKKETSVSYVVCANFTRPERQSRTWRWSPDASFRIIFLRLVFPRFWNLRIFSLLRWRFSFFAFTLHASSSVTDAIDRPTNGGTITNAWECWEWMNEEMLDAMH